MINKKRIFMKDSMDLGAISCLFQGTTSHQAFRKFYDNAVDSGVITFGDLVAKKPEEVDGFVPTKSKFRHGLCAFFRSYRDRGVEAFDPLQSMPKNASPLKEYRCPT